jgi:methionyl aminopeptidase
MNGRNDPCWCGSGKKWKKCHYPQLNPALSGDSLAKEYFNRYGIIIKTPEQIKGIRRSCRIAKRILDQLCQAAMAGVTTLELDQLSQELCKQAGAIPASLGYGKPPFPNAICTSVNDVICHGIPNKQPLQPGDICNIDIATIVDGYYGDCSAMVMIDSVSEEKQRLVEVTHECLERAIAILRPGLGIGEIGRAIEEHAHENNFSVVTQFVAHGVGVNYHEAPQIAHYANDSDITLVPGMTFTVEPMLNAGSPDGVLDRSDGWTVRTTDGRPSAQWEHTVLITPTGYEILTVSE